MVVLLELFVMSHTVTVMQFDVFRTLSCPLEDVQEKASHMDKLSSFSATPFCCVKIINKLENCTLILYF